MVTTCTWFACIVLALQCVFAVETVHRPGEREEIELMPPRGDAEYYVVYDWATRVGNRTKRSTTLRPGSATHTHTCGRVRGVPSKLRRATHMSPDGLTSFYTKYTEAYGIPVVASGVVPDDALKRACYIVRFLLADRYDVRNAFYQHFGRIGIIGKDQGTTDIPEHSWLADWWNERARGLGATTHWPICTAGEENLLCMANTVDRYHYEDIGIHEFLHGVHILGANFAINGYDSRLTNAYNSAKRSGLWENTYALSTRAEYFAEGARAFFDVKPFSATANGVHNDITTRSQLYTYDRTLYDLVAEVFPCANTYIKRCGSTRNAELNTHIPMNCGDEETAERRTTTTRKTVATTSSSCSDKSVHCGYWAGIGECDKNPGYMHTNCRESCELCGGTGTTTTPRSGSTTCVNKSEHCTYWEAVGECTKNPDYMHHNCQKSCRLC